MASHRNACAERICRQHEVETTYKTGFKSAQDENKKKKKIVYKNGKEKNVIC